MELTDQLIQFNLTRHESSIYIMLLVEGPLNGYEVAKLTGIARSNAYSSLASLVEKGGADILEEATVRYRPVPLGEFCDNKIRKLQDAKESLLKNMPLKKDIVEGYITIKGKENILNKLRTMILQAQERVYISVSDSVLEILLPEIENAIKRNIKTVIITNQDLVPDGAIHYQSKEALKQIRLIADSKNVITGDLNDGQRSTCLYSKKKNLIDLFKDAMKNEIELIELKKGNTYEKNICEQ